MAMTTKQAEALQKAQAAAKAKREAEKQANEQPKFNPEIAYKDLSDRLDKLTVMMQEVLDKLKAKSDLSFLQKFK
jgi:hypothetical protein